MTAPEVTDWYSGDQKPARKGIYQRYRPVREGIVWWSYWTGKHWGLLALRPEHAYLWRAKRSAFQRAYWRGLAQKP